MSIEINTEKCTRCKACIKACPFDAIKIEGERLQISEWCTRCAACISSCKFGAIEIKKDVRIVDALSDYKGVWVLAEHKKGKIAPITFELLGAGRRLADGLNVPVSTIVIGDEIQTYAQTLIAYGSDEVHLIEDPSLKDYNDELYCAVMTQLIREKKPEIILIGATANGRSLAPRIASRFNTGLTADCTGLEIDPDKKILIQTRPAFGGNLMASIICPHHRPQMATIRPRVMKPMMPDESREGKVIRPNVNIPKQTSVKTLGFLDSFQDGLNLAEADIILSAGKGLGKPENLELLKQLAQILGATIGASRAIVDAGWIDSCYQIGQTGKTVAPKFYFAFGISGAIQHLAGMSTSDIIIAVNKDKDAPIFKIANYGIVGDAVEVISAMIQYFAKKQNHRL